MEREMEEEKATAVKFGGSSLADAAGFRRVKKILQSDPKRRYVVVSAPGRRDENDEKVTDLLFQSCERARKGGRYETPLSRVKRRFQKISEELGLEIDLGEEFEKIERAILHGADASYTVSRGEYLCAKLMSAWLGFPFVDAAEVIRFDSEGRFEPERTDFFLREKFENLSCAVLPGFYGSDDAGNIHTFSRSGSDVTGALVARAIQAGVYENWTDVPGFLLADPVIVPGARKVDALTYAELRELAYRGASVLHEDAVYPVRREGIPIHILNTRKPDENGTLICEHLSAEQEDEITGIAGKKGYVAVSIAKNRMNAEAGFSRKLLEAFEENDISFEHLPSGIDTVSVILPKTEFETKEREILESLSRLLKPDKIEIDRDIALVTMVGKGMRSVSGIAARFFTALGEEHINIKMIDMGSNEINCTIGVRNEDFEPAVRALYHAFADSGEAEI